MSDDPQDTGSISILSTQLEEDFIAPLTAIRGALEILRDYPDIDPQERTRFVAGALTECARIERGIAHLGAAVYTPGRDAAATPADEERVALDAGDEIAELDFAGLTFDSAKTVDRIFDTIEEAVVASNRRWWFLVNYTDCHVFPEAWIAFAHRGKKIRVRVRLWHDPLRRRRRRRPAGSGRCTGADRGCQGRHAALNGGPQSQSR